MYVPAGRGRAGAYDIIRDKACKKGRVVSIYGSPNVETYLGNSNTSEITALAILDYLQELFSLREQKVKGNQTE